MKPTQVAMEMENQKNRSLIQLAQMAQSIEDQLILSEGLINPELEKMLTELESSLTTKTDAYGYIIRKLEAEADFYNHRATKLAEMASHLTSTATRLKDRAKEAMKRMNVSKLEGEEVKFSLSRGAGKVVIDELDKLPSNLVKTNIDIKPDKEKIGQLLRDGSRVTGAHLEESWTLRIKP